MMLGPLLGDGSDPSGTLWYLLLGFLGFTLVGAWWEIPRWWRRRKATVICDGNVFKVEVEGAGRRLYRVVVSFSFLAEGTSWGGVDRIYVKYRSNADAAAVRIEKKGVVIVHYEPGNPQNSCIKVLE